MRSLSTTSNCVCPNRQTHHHHAHFIFVTVFWQSDNSEQLVPAWRWSSGWLVGLSTRVSEPTRKLEIDLIFFPPPRLFGSKWLWTPTNCTSTTTILIIKKTSRTSSSSAPSPSSALLFFLLCSSSSSSSNSFPTGSKQAWFWSHIRGIFFHWSPSQNFKYEKIDLELWNVTVGRFTSSEGIKFCSKMIDLAARHYELEMLDDLIHQKTSKKSKDIKRHPKTYTKDIQKIQRHPMTSKDIVH